MRPDESARFAKRAREQRVGLGRRKPVLHAQIRVKLLDTPSEFECDMLPIGVDRLQAVKHLADQVNDLA
jgi:hypothetical protein